MANPIISNIDGTNPGPAGISTVNTQSPYSTLQSLQTIAVLMTPAAVATITSTEQSFGSAGTTYATLPTNIKPLYDVIVAVDGPSTVAGIGIVGYRVDPTVPDKWYVTFLNTTAGSVMPPSGTYYVTVARYNLANAANLPSAMV